MVGICRYAGLLALAGLLHCGSTPPDEGPTAPEAPRADRESWGAELEIGEPDLRVRIRAPYVQDRGNWSYATRGVDVEFHDPAGRSYSSLKADRLTLEHGGDQVSAGGKVAVQASDTVQVLADTLVWERAEGRLRVPGRVEITAPAGRVRGRDLETDFAFERWSMQEVDGRWEGRGRDRVYQVEIQARREDSRRQEGNLIVRYEHVVALYEGTTVRSSAGRYDEGAGVLRFTGGVSSSDSVRAFRAEEMDFRLADQQVEARGTVDVREGELRLAADELTQDRAVDVLRARGEPAVFEHGARSIRADRLEYRARAEVVRASGHVVFRDGGRLLRASQLVYRDFERLEAEGGILLEAPEMHGSLESGRLVYDLPTGQVELTESPRMRRRRDGGDMVIRAFGMRLDLPERRLFGEGELTVDFAELTIGAGRGTYHSEEEQLGLADRVTLYQENEEDGHSSRIEADSMVVYMRDGEPSRVEMVGGMQAALQGAEGRANWIRGAAGKLFFSDEKLDRIEVGGGADVTHKDREDVSRIRGEAMSLYFGDRRLQRVEALGQAEFMTSLPEDEGDQGASVNRVAGEELEVVLKDGAIVDVRIVKPEGRYHPPPKEDR